ncbi:MAG: 5'-3' exonuclease H3TH domain-containing protein, partial [Actinomycetota bacterium]|nr:5'-3' exonuclease H3TH domain-containing protein [Actinomycetota bacterium]
MKDKKNILLIDGHSLAYRAFFALPKTLTTSEGQPTNAVYGFTSMLLKAIEEEKPEYVVVAFDGPRAELHRTKVFEAYKAQRPPMPQEMVTQIEIINNVLEKMAIPRVYVQGYEADDILGTLAKVARKSGYHVEILTGDRDSLQLVCDGVSVILTSKGISETEIFDRSNVIEKYGVPPERIPDLKALEGDASDNIPGVPGIGKKTAFELVSKYGSLENIYEHIGEIESRKRKALEENREIAFLSKKLAIIETDIPVTLDLEEARLGLWNEREVVDFLSALEFKTLQRRFL